MSAISPVLSSLLIGFRTTHKILGGGIVVEVVEREAGVTYVRVNFDADGRQREFGADIFLGEWGSYFDHDLSEINAKAKELEQRQWARRAALRSLIARITSTATNVSRKPYLLLRHEDYALCMMWSGRCINQRASGSLGHIDLVEALGRYEAGRLMSARQAELVALDYYSALGHDVIDVSITQLDPESDGRWRLYDLSVDGRPVDVKNARRSFSNRDAYVEHCVPRFKQDRRTQNAITIMGILSEYESPSALSVGGADCVVLGEVNIDDIRRLYSWIKQRFGEFIDFHGLWTPEYQPGWAFDYSLEFYRDRSDALNNVDKVIRDCAEFALSDLLLKQSLVWLLALREDRELTNCVQVTNEDRAILDDLYALHHSIGITRPNLFVYVMAAVLEGLVVGKARDEVIPPLRNTILVSTGDPPFSPLGLVDPLNYISSMLEILDEVYLHVQSRALRFTSFRLQHPSILQGRSGEGWITLIAYCGGWRSNPTKVKCGAAPLYIGRHATCPACHHLICEECGFCALTCELVAKRQELVASTG